MEAMTRDKWESKILLDAIYNIIQALRNLVHARYVSAEKVAALAWYSGSGGLSGGILELPGRPDGFSPAKPCYLMQETFLDKYKPQFHFPYITSLLLEHLYRIDETMENWAPVPLDRTYPGNNPQFGAAIIDITDMGNITYGLLASKATPFVRKGPEGVMARHCAVPKATWIVEQPCRETMSAAHFRKAFDEDNSADHPFETFGSFLGSPLIPPNAVSGWCYSSPCDTSWEI